MPKNYIQILLYSILLFHGGIALHGLYTMFSDYNGWSLFHLRPFLQLLYTLAWLGICLKKRWTFFVYISLMFYELAMKLFFGKYDFGAVFGDVFFPVNLLFAIIVLMLYTQHFNEREKK
jgi:hypothetical protein